MNQRILVALLIVSLAVSSASLFLTLRTSTSVTWVKVNCQWYLSYSSVAPENATLQIAYIYYPLYDAQVNVSWSISGHPQTEIFYIDCVLNSDPILIANWNTELSSNVGYWSVNSVTASTLSIPP